MKLRLTKKQCKHLHMLSNETKPGEWLEASKEPFIFMLLYMPEALVKTRSNGYNTEVLLTDEGRSIAKWLV